jgi:hypothetical protein
MEEVYESDDEIFFVSTWGRSPTADKKHLIQWKIYNPQGERIYATTDRYVAIKSNSFYTERVSLSQKVRDEAKPGMFTVKLYLDDKLKKSLKLEYVRKSIVNHNIVGAVILPFSFEGTSHVRRQVYLSTASNAIYGEVQRIAKKTIPPAAAENLIAGDFPPEYFDDPSRMNDVKELFPENVLIAGTLNLPQYQGQASSLKVYTYELKTGHQKKFTYIATTVHEKYTLALSELLIGVLHKEGLLEYLQSL